MNPSTITITLDQRTLSLYSVGHYDYVNQLIGALKVNISDDSRIVILAGCGSIDHLEYADAVMKLEASNVDHKKIQQVIADVWASLPKTVTIGDTVFCIASAVSEDDQRVFVVTNKSSPAVPLFSGTWVAVSRWLHRAHAFGTET